MKKKKSICEKKSKLSEYNTELPVRLLEIMQMYPALEKHKIRFAFEKCYFWPTIEVVQKNIACNLVILPSFQLYCL